MRYTIKEHMTFRLRKPYKRVSDRDRLSMDYYRADERNDGESNLKVNVLIMAKAKKKNNKDSRVTAGELFAKLGRKDEKNADPEFDEEGFADEGMIEDELNFDAIDVSSGNEEDSDSELDMQMQMNRDNMEAQMQDEFYDHALLINDALWDRWFCSSVSMCARAARTPLSLNSKIQVL